MRCNSFVIMLLCVVLNGCGKDRPTPFVRESELADYANRFYEEIGSPTFHISMHFGDLDGDVIGLCTSWSDGSRDITIDKAEWDDMTDLGKEELMYHELGHCAMDLDHNNEVVVSPHGNIYGSIMNEYWFGDSWAYSNYRDLYKQALKERRSISF